MSREQNFQRSKRRAMNPGSFPRDNSARKRCAIEGIMRFILGLVPLAALLCAPVCATTLADGLPAAAYETDTILVCDTQEEAERFVALFTGDVRTAILAVNAEEQNPDACAMMDVMYLRGAKVSIARHGDDAFEVVRILVVGTGTSVGILPVRPAVYFSIFSVKEYAV
jgi:hypothetical protein